MGSCSSQECQKVREILEGLWPAGSARLRWTVFDADNVDQRTGQRTIFVRIYCEIYAYDFILPTPVPESAPYDIERFCRLFCESESPDPPRAPTKEE